MGGDILIWASRRWLPRRKESDADVPRTILVFSLSLLTFFIALAGFSSSICRLVFYITAGTGLATTLPSGGTALCPDTKVTERPFIPHTQQLVERV